MRQDTLAAHDAGETHEPEREPERGREPAAEPARVTEPARVAEPVRVAEPPRATEPHRESLAPSAPSDEEHRPVAHFEPAPPLEGAGSRAGAKPYVVWSSAPSGNAPHEPGHEEGS